MNLIITNAGSFPILSQNECILFPNQDRLCVGSGLFLQLKDLSKKQYSLENIDLSIYISGYFDL
jgi:hypothetical protein